MWNFSEGEEFEFSLRAGIDSHPHHFSACITLETYLLFQGLHLESATDAMILNLDCHYNRHKQDFSFRHLFWFGFSEMLVPDQLNQSPQKSVHFTLPKVIQMCSEVEHIWRDRLLVLMLLHY
jgi:hypothetical protein